jgi:hypothetical protein
MKMIPVVSWGMYGGATASERAHAFVSWGLRVTIYSGLESISRLLAYYRRLRG